MHSWDKSFLTKFSEKNTTVPRTTPCLLSEPQNYIKSFILFVCLLIFCHFSFLFIIKLVYHLTTNSFLLYFSSFLRIEINTLKCNSITTSIFISTTNAPCDSFLSIIWKTPCGSKGREYLSWKYEMGTGSSQIHYVQWPPWLTWKWKQWLLRLLLQEHAEWFKGQTKGTLWSVWCRCNSSIWRFHSSHLEGLNHLSHLMFSSHPVGNRSPSAHLWDPGLHMCSNYLSPPGSLHNSLGTLVE